MKRRSLIRWITVSNVMCWLFALAMLATRPSDDGRVAVMVWPGSSQSDVLTTIARANGVLVAGTSLPFIALAQSGDPDFASRLWREGAVLVFNPMLAGGCRPVI